MYMLRTYDQGIEEIVNLQHKQRVLQWRGLMFYNNLSNT